MSKPYSCQICGTTFPIGWSFENTVDVEKLLRVIETQKKALEFYTDAAVLKAIDGWCDDGKTAREVLAEVEKILKE